MIRYSVHLLIQKPVTNTPAHIVEMLQDIKHILCPYCFVLLFWMKSERSLCRLGNKLREGHTRRAWSVGELVSLFIFLCVHVCSLGNVTDYSYNRNRKCELELAPLMKLIHRNLACYAVAQPVRHLLPGFFSSFFFFSLHRDIWFLKDALSQKLIHILTINSSQWVTLVCLVTYKHTHTERQISLAVAPVWVTVWCCCQTMAPLFQCAGMK